MNFNFGSNILTFSKLIMPRLYDIPILVYHSVGINHQNSIHIDNFRRHLDFFKDNNYKILGLEELIGNFQLKRRAYKNSVCLTFDDGREDFFTHAWPLIRHYNFPVTIFPVVGKIGQRGYLGFEQIKEMLSGGLLTVGSHTMGHRCLLDLDPVQLKVETQESKRLLEDNLNCGVHFFSYPWGEFSSFVQRMVKEAGYKAAFTTNQGINRSIRHSDVYALKRLTMAEADNFFRFLVKVSGLGYCFSRRICRERWN